MKKLFGGVALLLLIISGVFGYKYYFETYITHTEYAKTPAKIPAKTQTKDARGKIVENMYSYKYKMTFFDKEGVSHKRETDIHGEQVSPLPTKTIVKIKTSKKRATAPEVISESEVPTSILEKLNAESGGK